MKNTYLVNAALGLVFIASPAWSQSAGDDANHLEEVIVTAQKRAERLQDVPIAVTAISEKAIEAARIDTTQDLQFAVPNLIYTSQFGNAQPYLRGIGSELTGANGDPSVATYIDGVYQAGTYQSLVSLLGVERIEVLKGPQGTLYGRNAVGGAINISTIQPGRDTTARVSATIGNYGREEVSGQFSGPATDELSLGVYFAYRSRDGYIKQITSPRPRLEPGKETEFGIRGKAVYEPSDRLKITATIEHSEADQSDNVDVRQIQSNASGFAAGGLRIIQRFRTATDGGAYIKPDQTTGSIQAEADLGPIRARTITAVNKLDILTGQDADTTTADIFNAYSNPRSKEFSQEVQFLSPVDSKIQWIGGLFYLRQATGFYPASGESPILFRGASPAAVKREIQSEVLLHSYAIFGQATVPLVENLNLTVGARYTSDDKSLVADQRFFDIAGNQVGTVTNYQSDAKWDKFTPKVTLDYKIGDTLLYATYSKGFKSGVYAASSPAAPSVAPETLDAYEVGVKMELLDRRVRFNTAAYHYDFKDLQVQIISVATGGSVLLQNAAGSRNYGVESELDVRLTDGLTLRLAGSYNHARYVDFRNAAVFVPAAVGNTNVVRDVTGNQVVKSPTWTGSLGLNYRTELADGAAFDANFQYAYNSGFYWDALNSIEQKAYGVANASATYTFKGGDVDVSLWMTNVFDKNYLKASLFLAFGRTASDAEPRMFGITTSWKIR